MTPEDAFTILRSMAKYRRTDKFAQLMVLKAVDTLETYVDTLDPAECRAALARAASNASAPTDDVIDKPHQRADRPNT